MGAKCATMEEPWTTTHVPANVILCTPGTSVKHVTKNHHLHHHHGKHSKHYHQQFYPHSHQSPQFECYSFYCSELPRPWQIYVWEGPALWIPCLILHQRKVWFFFTSDTDILLAYTKNCVFDFSLPFNDTILNISSCLYWNDLHDQKKFGKSLCLCRNPFLFLVMPTSLCPNIYTYVKTVKPPCPVQIFRGFRQ